jgi:hypothetical protein
MSKFSPISKDAFTGRVLDEDSLRDAAGVLEIVLLDEKKEKVIVRFDDFVAYRKLDEGDAFNILHEISTTSTLGHTLYLVDGSQFLEWFSGESQHVRDRQGLKHFCLITLNSVVDVIAFNEPKVQQSIKE